MRADLRPRNRSWAGRKSNFQRSSRSCRPPHGRVSRSTTEEQARRRWPSRRRARRSGWSPAPLHPSRPKANRRRAASSSPSRPVAVPYPVCRGVRLRTAVGPLPRGRGRRAPCEAGRCATAARDHQSIPTAHTVTLRPWFVLGSKGSVGRPWCLPLGYGDRFSRQPSRERRPSRLRRGDRQRAAVGHCYLRRDVKPQT